MSTDIKQDVVCSCIWNCSAASKRWVITEWLNIDKPITEENIYSYGFNSYSFGCSLNSLASDNYCNCNLLFNYEKLSNFRAGLAKVFPSVGQNWKFMVIRTKIKYLLCCYGAKWYFNTHNYCFSFTVIIDLFCYKLNINQ